MVENVDIMLSDENLEKAASEILNAFKSFVPSDKIADEEEREKAKEKSALDFEYHIAKDGTMVSEDVNTEFKYDPEKGDVLWDVTEAFYHDDENRLPTEEDFEKLDLFVAKLTKLLEIQRKDEIRTIIRDKVLNNADEKFIPLKLVRINEVELSSPAMPYIVRVLKGVPVNDEDVPKTQISAELTQEFLDSGKSFEQIIAEKKALGDEKYRYVFGVHLKKEWFRCHLHMWADYSTVKPEETDLGKARQEVKDNDAKQE